MNAVVRVRPTISVDSFAISPGALLNTSASDELIHQINRTTANPDWFYSQQNPYNQLMDNFVNNVVKPSITSGIVIAQATSAYILKDEYRPIVKAEDLATVPPSMMAPILMDPYLRNLLERGRIGGWGIDPETLHPEDCYGRLINNGFVEDIGAAAKANDGYVTFEHLHWSDDPDITFDELDALDVTRQFMRQVAENELKDPTSYPDDLG